MSKNQYIASNQTPQLIFPLNFRNALFFRCGNTTTRYAKLKL